MTEKFILYLKAWLKRNKLEYKVIASQIGVTETDIKNYMRNKPVWPPHLLAKVFQENAKHLSARDMEDFGLQSPEMNSFAADPPVTYTKAKAGHPHTAHFKTRLARLITPIIDNLPDATYDIFEVEGSSMEPTFSAGDRIICRLDNMDKMIDDRAYIIRTDDQLLHDYRPSGIWLKRCVCRKNAWYIVCRSDNKSTSEPYPTFQIKFESVKELWYPVLRITSEMRNPHADLMEMIKAIDGRLEVVEQIVNNKNSTQ